MKTTTRLPNVNNMEGVTASKLAGRSTRLWVVVLGSHKVRQEFTPGFEIRRTTWKTPPPQIWLAELLVAGVYSVANENRMLGFGVPGDGDPAVQNETVFAYAQKLTSTTRLHAFSRCGIAYL